MFPLVGDASTGQAQVDPSDDEELVYLVITKDDLANSSVFEVTADPDFEQSRAIAKLNWGPLVN